MSKSLDELIDRRGTNCSKWDKDFGIGEKSLLPLWVADMDFPCSEAIQNALHRRVDEQIYGYTLGMDKEYKQAIVNWLKKRFDWCIDESSIFYASGVIPAITYLLELLSDEGDGIVIQTPVYPPFKAKIEATSRVVVENPLINEHGYYTMDFNQLEECFKDKKVKGMILCSPHNPVGRVWNENELRKVVELAKRYDKWIISDEIHCDLIRHDVKQIPLMKIAEDYKDKIICCSAASKSFNLAGLQVSHVIINDPQLQMKWNEFVVDRLGMKSPNNFAITALKAAYNESESWLDEVNRYIDGNFDYAIKYLQEKLPKAVISPREGTYLMWVDLSAYCDDEKKLEKYLLANSIVVNQGYTFGENGKGFIRINLACPRCLVEECVERLVEMLG